MSDNGLTPKQRAALATAISCQQVLERDTRTLGEAVRQARAAGIPILFLADALGVSRSRIRVLAR